LDEKYPEKFFNTTIVGQALQFDQICLKENQQTLNKWEIPELFLTAKCNFRL